MTAAEYWRRRDLQNATKLYDYADRQGELVTRWFARAAKEMDAKVRDCTRKYATGHRLTYQQAKASLADKTELAKLMENYQLLLAVAPSDPVANNWLTRLHTSLRINREEYLKAQLDLITSTVYGKYADVTTQTLNKLFEESYYKSMFDQQQFVGFGNSFNRLSIHAIAAATSTAWSGKNYSQIIWGDHRVALARYTNRIIATGIIEGKPNQLMSAELQKAMSTSAYKARRLIRTEASYVAARGNLLGYQEFGTRQYAFLATLDFKTSLICRSMDGQVFDVSDAQPGVNMPPLHAFCRSTTVPHVPDADFDAGDTRAARDGKGSTFRVPANMIYPEWYATHVEKDAAELLAAQKYKHGQADAAQWKRYQTTLGKDMPNSLDKFQQVKYTDADRYTDLKRQYRHTNYYNTHLTHAEQAAVKSYISSGSFGLNARLRTKVPLDASDRALVVALDAALEKLPAYEGSVTRSLVMEHTEQLAFVKEILSGDCAVFSAYTSASTLPDYHDTPSVRMRIASKTGRDLRTVNRSEQEILFRRDTKFRVLKADYYDGVFVLEMEEIT